ncbi:MAG: hypothetical protein O2894_00635 [Planctomycetota bacterium]|nr:hypothetical protein [Planctomycetota bacterium]
MFELAIMMGILSIMALIVQATIDGATRAERRVRAVRTATERSERLTYELLAAVNGSRILLTGDGVGAGYLGALELDARPLLTGARLPRTDALAALAPDEVGDPHTGNILLFARESDAVEAVADAPTAQLRHIDLYRIVCCYPTETDRKLILDAPVQPARDLVVWRSVRYANLTQLQDIEDDDERRSVVADLVGRFGCDLAWDVGAPVDEAFFRLGSLGTIESTPVVPMSIEEDPDAGEGGRLVHAHTQLAPTKAGDPYRRARLSPDDPAVWKPDGFEVKVTGLSGTRKVWMHLVVESPGGKGVVGVQSNTVIAHPRDL